MLFLWHPALSTDKRMDVLRIYLKYLAEQFICLYIVIIC